VPFAFISVFVIGAVEAPVFVCKRSSCSHVIQIGGSLRFVRLELKVVMQNDGDFVDVILLQRQSSPQNKITTAQRGTAVLPTGQTRYPLYNKLGGPQGWSGRLLPPPPPPGFDPPTVQPVAIRYTDSAIPANVILLYTIIRRDLSEKENTLLQSTRTHTKLRKQVIPC
jgi:hypothetical protein